MATADKYSDRVVDAYKALSRHVVSGARGRAPAWPFSILETTIFYSKFFTIELLHTMRELERKGLGRDDIARMFYGPSAVSHWAYLAGFPFEGLDRDDVIEFIERTIDLLEFWRQEDPFCESWRNLTWDSARVAAELSREGFIETSGNQSLAQTVGKINMIAWHYCILVQVGHRNYSHEFHGPYPLADDAMLFVREYFNLRPTEIWPFAAPGSIPFDRMTLLEVYKDVQLRVDMFNHVWASSSLGPHLRAVLVVLDDSKALTATGVDELLVKWTDIITRANAYVKGFTKQDWITKVIEMKYWLLRPHKAILQADWSPPASVLSLAGRYEEVELVARQAIQGQMGKIIGFSEEEAIRNITQMYLDNIYEGKMYF